jgi:L-alanine-DL-glutamate epimerase-like enolase superfamily enzyme
VKIAKVEPLQLNLASVKEKAQSPQEALIVRVVTDTGLAGHGEAASNASVVRAIVEAPRADHFRHGLASILIGADPLDPEARWKDMYDGTRWYGRRGAVIHAMSAVDTALWDIVGQANGQPCHALWGTRRDRIRAYASLYFPDTAMLAAERAEDLAARGFTAIKFAWGRFGRDREWDLAALGAIRGAVGDKVALMVDAGRVWQQREAQKRVPELFERFGLTFLEEPLHEDDTDGYEALCASLDGRGRIAAGETEEIERSFVALLDRGVTVLQPDIGRAGGPSICRRLSSLAHARGSWCIAHSFGTGVQISASTHWMASAPEAPMTEYPITESPLRNDLVCGMPQLIDGFVTAPTRPGLGITLDGDTVARFRVP